MTFDPTKNTTALDFMSPADREALKAHGGPYQVYCSRGWITVNFPAWLGHGVYRVKPPEPVREHWCCYVTKHGGIAREKTLGIGNQQGVIYYDLIDGVFDPASVKGELLE